jgi:hypothetical protein
MNLPVPKTIANSLYVGCEVQAPSLDCIAKARSSADSTYFPALRILCAECVKDFITEDGKIISDPVSIKSIIPKLPFKSAEFIVMQSLLLQNEDDDSIEGYYPCPRCGQENISEYRNDDGIEIDTRDHISEFKIGYFDPYNDNEEIHVELTDPVVISDKGDDGDVLLEVNDFDVVIPTLENCIIAEAKVGIKDPLILQLAIYVEAMTKVNGQKVDAKFKKQWGMFFLGKIRTAKKDIGALSDEINKYGIIRKVKKTCKKCGKVWEPTPNTSNFFASAPLSL